jgi:hypothetical protein
MKTLTKENAKTKFEISVLLYIHKFDDFNSFTSLVEQVFTKYYKENVPRGRPKKRKDFDER